jgi:hypothetical protein
MPDSQVPLSDFDRQISALQKRDNELDRRDLDLERKVMLLAEEVHDGFEAARTQRAELLAKVDALVAYFEIPSRIGKGAMVALGLILAGVLYAAGQQVWDWVANFGTKILK